MQKKLLALLLASTAAISCAQNPKALPELPLTMDNMANFTDKQDWQALKVLRNATEEEEYFLRRHYFIDDIRLIQQPDILTKRTYLGGDIITPSSSGYEVETRRPYAFDNVWDFNGHLINLGIEDYDDKNKPALEALQHLRGLRLNLRNSDLVINLEDYQLFKRLDSLALQNVKIKNASAACAFEQLTNSSTGGSYPTGQFHLVNCKAPFRALAFGTARLDDLKVASLPNLTLLYLGNSTIHKLAIEGDSLPALVSLDLNKTDLPTDLSQVTLPKGLVQLNLQGMRDNDISQLELPKNLQYLNLKEAKLDDYRFITTAKNLESLRLDESNFNQWALLKKLPNLKHLKLGDTSVTTDDLEIISQLKQLEYLSLSGTAVTSVQKLTALPKLKMLILFQAAITDYAEIPYFENLIAFGIPNQSQLSNSPETLPEHIIKMVETARIEIDVSGLSEELIQQNPKVKYRANYGKSCLGHKDCTLAPWYLDN